MYLRWQGVLRHTQGMQVPLSPILALREMGAWEGLGDIFPNPYDINVRGIAGKINRGYP